MLEDTLLKVSPKSTFKTLHPDKWGSSPWYPLLALQAIEETALPVFKGQKKMLKMLKLSRPKREWLIGNYYWLLWKWHMKEIHKDDFKFVPVFCVTSLRTALLQPCPEMARYAMAAEDDQAPVAKVRLTDGAYGQ